MPSIKKNFGYNLLLTFCGYLIPLITYPYISRVLGVQNIGICNFVDSVINYFVLFSMLGIGSFGVREIARVRQDVERRSYVFSNLITINILTTVLAVVVLLVCTFFVPKFADYKQYLFIGVAKLIFNVLLIEWFYQGIQDFRYITIRSLLVKLVYVVGIFIFIHTKEDVLLYYFLTFLTTIINALINWVHARKLVHINFQNLDIRVFLMPIISFGYYRILTSMYTTFNTVFLGFSFGDVEVGYFATATKLYAIIMSVFTAFTTVMVPKVSELLNEGKTDKLQWIADQTLSVVSSVCMPIIIFSQFCAADIIRLIAGPGYDGAIIPFRIVIFMLLVIGSEQILIQQFLMASTKNAPILIVSTIGAVVGVLLNILFTPKMGAIGSAIAWSVSELTVLVAGIFYVKRNLRIKVNYQNVIVNLLWSLLYVIPLCGIYYLNLDLWGNLLASAAITATLFVLINLWLHKNTQIIELAGSITKYFKL